MFLRLRSVLTFFKLSFFLLAICLTILNINDRYNTNKTTVTTYAVDLSKVDFPVSFSLIVSPGFKDMALQTNGYEDGIEYFGGQSRFSEDHYGWAGHTEEGGIISSVSGNTNH
jgi:hypothetical protein